VLCTDYLTLKYTAFSVKPAHKPMTETILYTSWTTVVNDRRNFMLRLSARENCLAISIHLNKPNTLF